MSMPPAGAQPRPVVPAPRAPTPGIRGACAPQRGQRTAVTRTVVSPALAGAPLAPVQLDADPGPESRGGQAKVLGSLVNKKERHAEA